MIFYSLYSKITMIALLLVGSVQIASAQEDFESRFPTNKLRSKTIDDKRQNRPKVKNIVFIYKKNTLNTLYGNPCALDVTRRWRFEYAVEDNTNVYFKKSFARATNNLWVKTRLFFTKGPWWKLVINKRFKDCQVKTGDATG
jgi:hypothetical protein